MRRVNTRIRLIDIKVFLLAVLCVCLLSPAALRTVKTAGILLIFGFYMILQFGHLLHSDAYERNTICLIILYIGMILLYTFLGKSDKGGGQTDIIISLFPYFMIVSIYKNMNRRHCVFIVTVCIMTIFLTLIQNYALWIRMGNRFSQQWYRRAGIREVVNTQYVCAIMLFSGILLCMFLYKKNGAERFLYLGLTVLCFLFNILVTQRANTLLLSIAMFTLLFLVNGRITRGKIIRYSLFLLAVLVFSVEYQPILNWLANVTNSERIQARINSVNTLITTRNVADVEAGSLTARLRLIGVSVNTFWGSIPNFFFGVGDKANNLLVGNHSYFFDEFAKFGIFGGVLSCSIILRMLKTTKKIISAEAGDSLNKFANVMIITVILRGLSGGVYAPATSMVLYVFAPLAFNVLKYDKERLS